MPKPYLPKGYTFEVDTQENDGDSGNTTRFTVLTKEEAVPYAELLKLFDANPDIQNLYEPGPEEVEACVEAFRPWAEAHEAFVNKQIDNDRKLTDDEDLYYFVLDVASDLGMAGNSEFDIRDLSSWRVFYNPEAVYLNDVTKEFKG